jgi:hypothetical protein
MLTNSAAENESNRALRDGPPLSHFQALRTWLPSSCPCGTARVSSGGHLAGLGLDRHCDIPGQDAAIANFAF